MKILQRGTDRVLWEGETLAFADLSSKVLACADLSCANLSRANLTDADLTDADLYGANLCYANLSNADLSDANLSGVNLYGANLSRANLYGANLSRANLYGANLSDANLSGAGLTGANLSRANLIVGGQRSDGYRFLLIRETNGAVKVSAGCRYFSIPEATMHWKKTRADTQLGKESLALVKSLVDIAKIIGWEV